MPVIINRNTNDGIESVIAWSLPEVTDAELRAAGYMPASRAFPHSEAGARWVAAFNGIPFEKIPAAWCYASNAHMLAVTEQRALDALESA